MVQNLIAIQNLQPKFIFQNLGVFWKRAAEAKVATGSSLNETEGKKEALRQSLREALSNAGGFREASVNRERWRWLWSDYMTCIIKIVFMIYLYLYI